MKNILNLMLIFIISYTCQGQTPIIDLRDQNGKPVENQYAQDLNNVLDSFVGTYVYQSGSTYLKIELQKRTFAFDNYSYEDLLIGEYKYIENGMWKADKLSDLYDWNDREQSHSIQANLPLKAGDYLCQGCTANEIRIQGSFRDRETQNHAQLIISKKIVNGQQAIAINLWWQTGTKLDNVPYTYPLLPGGNWTLLKQ